MIGRNFLKNRKRLRKLFLAIGRYFLIVLMSINSILGASTFSLGLIILIARSREFYGSDVGVVGLGIISCNYGKIALFWGIIGYIVISGLALYPIKKVLSPNSTLSYWIGVMFGIPFLFFSEGDVKRLRKRRERSRLAVG